MAEQKKHFIKLVVLFSFPSSYTVMDKIKIDEKYTSKDDKT
jgi:hypothetical protein